MLDWLKGLVSGPQEMDTPIIQMTPVAAPASIPAEAPSTGAEIPSPTEKAQKRLTAMLTEEMVTSIPGGPLKASTQSSFPVNRLLIGESQMMLTHYDGMHIASLGSEKDNTPLGEELIVSVELAKPATDFNKASIGQAMRDAVAKISSLAGRIHVAEEHPERCYGDAWQELKPLIMAKEDVLTPQVPAMFGTYFDAHKARADAPIGKWETIHASHHAGIVEYVINARELEGDNNAVKSTDETILDYFKQHHDEILTTLKKKAEALGILQPGELDKLDLQASADGWRITVNLFDKGEGPTPNAVADGDAAKSEAGKGQAATPLAKINTDKLSEIFAETLFEGKELPSITPRVLDGPTIAHILHHRLGKDPAIDAVLNKYAMFKTEQEVQAANEERAKQGMIELGEPQFGSSSSGKSVVELKFHLPAGMKVTDIIQVLEQEPQPQPSNTVTDAQTTAKIATLPRALEAGASMAPAA